MTIVMAGHYPPPVHGMAAVVADLADRVEQHADVVRLNLAAGDAPSRLRHHLRRLSRVVGACGRLVVLRRRSRTLCLSADAGLGMLYTATVLATARLLRYRRFLHHHSFDYVDERSGLMALVTRVGGRSCRHLVLCEAMGNKLARQYPAVGSLGTLGLPVVVPDAEVASSRHRTSRPGGAIVLGHLSNLSREKGFETVLATLDEVRRRGIPSELVLAGPTVTRADRVALDQHLGRTTGVRYLGPVYGDAKRRFFDDIDVFLFPSAYSHEAFGIVVLEALASGKPVIALQRGCLVPETIGDAGVVAPFGTDFPEAAADAVERWFPGGRAVDGLHSASRNRFEALRSEAGIDLDRTIDLLVAST